MVLRTEAHAHTPPAPLLLRLTADEVGRQLMTTVLAVHFANFVAARGRRYVDAILLQQADLVAFLESLAADVDVSWALRRGPHALMIEVELNDRLMQSPDHRDNHAC